MKKRIKHLINHWSVTSKHVRVADIRRMHLVRGWRDIGYHRIILHPESSELLTKRDELQWWDLVKQGRSLNEDLFIEQHEVGAHTLYQNRDSIGICTVGHPDYPLHPLQEKAIIQTNLTLLERFQLKPKSVYGHREFNPTQCPGDEIFKVLKTIRRIPWPVQKSY